MAQLPQIRRLLVEDFLSQKEWISKLFQPLNNFMEGVASVFNKSITIKDNMLADIVTVTLSSVPTATNPYPLKWSLNQRPQSVHVGNVVRLDNIGFTLSAAVAVQWTYDANNGFRLTNVVGITPSSTVKYTLTLVCFAG
jgi:hypothetical protein